MVKLDEIKAKARVEADKFVEWVDEYKPLIAAAGFCVYSLVLYSKSFDYGYECGKNAGIEAGVKGAADHYIAIMNRYPMPKEMIEDAKEVRIPGLKYRD